MMQRHVAIPIESKRALVALAASNTLGVLALFVIPLIVMVLMVVLFI